MADPNYFQLESGSNSYNKGIQPSNNIQLWVWYGMDSAGSLMDSDPAGSLLNLGPDPFHSKYGSETLPKTMQCKQCSIS